MEGAPTYRGVPAPPGMNGGIWSRPEGRGGPWAQKQAQGAETDPQVPHGASGALRRELGVKGALDVDKSQEHLASAAYACEVRRKLSRTSTDSARLNR